MILFSDIFPKDLPNSFCVQQYQINDSFKKDSFLKTFSKMYLNFISIRVLKNAHL